MPYYMHELNPDYNPVVGLVQHLSTEELQQLLNDDDRIHSMIKELQQVKNAEAEREMLLSSNKGLAEYNLSIEPRFRQLRDRLLQLYNNAVVLKQEVEERKQKIDERTKQTSLDTTLALLQTAAAQSEEESETIAEKFLDGETTVDTFTEQFLEMRKLAHLRRVKAEKMTDLLSRTSTQNHFNPPPSRIPPASSRLPSQPAFAYPGAFPPYPVPSQIGMPMPQFR